MRIGSRWSRLAVLLVLSLAVGIGCPQAPEPPPPAPPPPPPPPPPPTLAPGLDKFAVVTIDANCVADPQRAEIAYQPTDPNEKTEVLWIFTSIPEGGSAAIDAKPVDQQGADGEKKRKMFKLKYKADDADDRVIASGKVRNPPPYPGGNAPVWKYTITIVGTNAQPVCTVDPGVCVRGSGGSVCEPSI